MLFMWDHLTPYTKHLSYGIIDTVRQVFFMYRKKDKSKQTQSKPKIK